MKMAQVAQKEEDKKSKGLFTNMCKAIGKGPIPEPYKEPDGPEAASSVESERHTAMV